MSPIALPTYKPNVSESSNILIEELSIPTINTKYSYNIAKAKQIYIRSRNVSELKFNFDNGIKNFTIPKGNSINLENILIENKIIYIEASTPTTIELLLLF